MLPPPAKKAVQRVVGSRKFMRLVRRPIWGNLRRLEPFSARYGFDRGTPIDRMYLARFFAAHAGDIRGRVLEIRDPGFTDRHGTGVESIDVMDIDPRNDLATILGDVTEAGSLPAAAFDCAIVPQTLHLVSDIEAALTNIWQSLKPGGVLLVTFPAMAKQDHEFGALDRWRMLPTGLALLLARVLPEAEVDIVGYGNLITAHAFLFALAAEELRESERTYDDPRYPILTCARVVRPPS